jgi:hypothetical protein
MLQQEPIIKIVSTNGQISIGKEYAGSQVQIIKQDDDTLLIKKGKFIPDNELWLYESDNLKRLRGAVKWAKSHKRRENFEEIEKVIEND